jgi:predicted kinase
LAALIVQTFGFSEVDVDETKINIFGPNILDASLKPEDWVRIYAETDRSIEHLLQSGKTVVDASRYFQKSERDGARQIAQECGAPLILIYVDTPEAVARERLAQNRQKTTRRDVSDADFEDVIRAMQPPGPEEKALIIHYEDDIHRWMEKHGACFSSA